MFGVFRGNETDNRLVEQTVSAMTMMGMPSEQALEMAKQLLKSIKSKLSQAGRAGSMYETGLGNDMLAAEKKIESVKQHMEACRKNGATNEDIRRWNNLCELERVLLLEQDTLLLTATFRALRDEGISDELAAKQAAKVHPRYTPNAEKIGQEEHTDLLPAELKLRVNDYRISMLLHDTARLKRDIDDAGDFNAMVREKLAKGSL